MTKDLNTNIVLPLKDASAEIQSELAIYGLFKALRAIDKIAASLRKKPSEWRVMYRMEAKVLKPLKATVEKTERKIRKKYGFR